MRRVVMGLLILLGVASVTPLWACSPLTPCATPARRAKSPKVSIEARVRALETRLRLVEAVLIAQQHQLLGRSR